MALMNGRSLNFVLAGAIPACLAYAWATLYKETYMKSKYML